MSKCLVQADLRGVDTHGLARLSQYLERANKGMVKVRPSIRMDKRTPVAVHMDGDNGFGFVLATKAMAEAISIAQTYGIGIVVVKNSNHFGMAASYVLQALESGLISLVFTNAGRNLPPFGGKEALLGTSPFAAGAPSDTEVPFVLDMAPTIVAKGKVRKAARRGESIPDTWALDQDGKPTTDPNVALDGGTLAPIGGPKGSGIAMLMDIMGGVLSGAAFGGDVGDQYKNWSSPQNVGHTFIAIKPDVFVGAEEFRERLDTLVKRVHAVTPAAGFHEVLFPGEPEYRMHMKRSAEGIPYMQAEVDLLKEAAAKMGVAELVYSEVPFNKQKYRLLSIKLQG
jgi:LDH2 family malate/lactate/ureidoglycolate dehydrogenase